MSKKEITIYTCDRCGKELATKPHTISSARFLRVITWWVSTKSEFEVNHLCDDCWAAFEGFMEELKPIGGRDDG